MKRMWILRGALIWGAFNAAACDSDDDGTGGGGQGDAGSIVAIGSGLDGSGIEAVTDASPADATQADVNEGGPESGVPTGASDASAPAYALFVGTDFNNAELSVFDLRSDSIAGQLPIADEDSVPYASAGLGFVLEHTLGRVVLLDPTQPWMAKATVDINDSPDASAYGSNPRTVLVTTGTKAYVAQYASNGVKIIDVAAGTVTGSVDLSGFVAADDIDGLVDVQDGAYDPASKRAYFLLERINQGDFGTAPDYVGACLTSHGEIVAIDVTTDAIVDLSGADAGAGIDLLGDDPSSLIPDFANGRLIVPETGCNPAPNGGTDGGAPIRIGRGIESIALATGKATWLYQTSTLDRLDGLVWIDETHAFVNQGDQWFAWNPTETALGNTIANFPLAPFYDGATRIIGLSSEVPGPGSDAATSWSVVAFDVATSALSTLATDPFQSVVPSAPFGVASAYVH